MADLKTDYKDDVLDTEVNELRKYQMIQNEDGTVSFVDVTEYLQVGDSFGSADINETNAEIEEIKDNQEAKYQELENAIDTKVTNSFTASRVLGSTTGGKISVTPITTAELGYLDGATSNIQTQLNDKLSKSGGQLTGNITGTSHNMAMTPDGNIRSDLWGGWLNAALANKVTNSFTGGRAMVSHASGYATVSATTSTEISYLSGAKSNIQTQLNGKLNKVTETQSATGTTILEHILSTGSAFGAFGCLNAPDAPHYQGEYAYFWFGSSSRISVIAKKFSGADHILYARDIFGGAWVQNNWGTIPTASVSGTTLNLTL